MADLESLIASTAAVFKPYEKLIPQYNIKFFSRPPLKFLALCVAALNKKTGYATNLFTDEQLQGNLPDRDSKLNFFADLRKYTEVLVGQGIDVDPKQIAAGKDVEKTLVLMQSMVRAAESPVVPFEQALVQVRPEAAGGEAPPAAKAKPPPKPKEAPPAEGEAAKPPAKKGKPAEEADKPAEGAAEAPKKPPAKKAAPKAAEAPGEAAPEGGEPAKKPPAKKAAPKAAEAPAEAPAEGAEPAKKPPSKKAAPKPAEAPAEAPAEGAEPVKKAPAKKVAKPAEPPAEVAEDATESPKKSPAKKVAKPAEAPAEGGAEAEKAKPKQKQKPAAPADGDADVEKPKPKQKPGPKTEEVLDATDKTTTGAKSRKPPPKKEAVVVDTVVAPLIQEAVDDDVDDIFVEEDGRGAHATDGENGKLVKEILAAARQLEPEQGKPDYMGDIDRFKQGIDLAKGLLQHLARSAQPLDTLIQFSQEDLGNMENEYKRWTSECERQERALETERLQTEQQLQELNGKLEELCKDIERQETQLRRVKAAAFLKEVDLMKQFATFST
jgi:hypothetical protein